MSGVAFSQPNSRYAESGFVEVASELAFIALMAALFVASSKRANLALLSAAILLMFGEALVSLV